MCDGDYDDSVEIRRGWQRARLSHQCFACRETIRIGDRYHVTHQRYDGALESYKHCARCWQICEALWANGAEAIDFGLNCGETWEDAMGALPAAIAALAFLTPDEAQQAVQA